MKEIKFEKRNGFFQAASIIFKRLGGCRFAKARVLLSRSGQAAAEMGILCSVIVFCFSSLLIYGQRLQQQTELEQEAFRTALKLAYDLNANVSYTLKRNARFTNILGGFGEGQSSTLSASASAAWNKGSPGPAGEKTVPSFAFYQINDDLIGATIAGQGVDGYSSELGGLVVLPLTDEGAKHAIGHDGTETDIRVPLSTWRETSKQATKYSSTHTKEEDMAGMKYYIRNKRISDLKDTVNTELYYRYDKRDSDAREDYLEPQYMYRIEPEVVGAQGAYYDSSSNRVKYGRGHAGTTIKRKKTWKTDWATD